MWTSVTSLPLSSLIFRCTYGWSFVPLLAPNPGNDVLGIALLLSPRRVFCVLPNELYTGAGCPQRAAGCVDEKDCAGCGAENAFDDPNRLDPAVPNADEDPAPEPSAFVPEDPNGFAAPRLMPVPPSVDVPPAGGIAFPMADVPTALPRAGVPMVPPMADPRVFVANPNGFVVPNLLRGWDCGCCENPDPNGCVCEVFPNDEFPKDVDPNRLGFAVFCANESCCPNPCACCPSPCACCPKPEACCPNSGCCVGKACLLSFCGVCAKKDELKNLFMLFWSIWGGFFASLRTGLKQNNTKPHLLNSLYPRFLLLLPASAFVSASHATILTELLLKYSLFRHITKSFVWNFHTPST